jgi:hypothetical protein
VKITDNGRPSACQTGYTNVVKITVNAKPAINPQTLTICSGGTFNITPVDGVDGVVPAGTTYTWTVSPAPGNVTGQSPETIGQASISQSLTNTTNTQQTVVYTVMPTSGAGCVGSQFTVTVKVNPEPSIASQTVTICSNAKYDLIPNVPPDIVPTGTLYSWELGGGYNPNISGSVNNGLDQSEFTQTLTNNTSSTQQIKYNVTPNITIDGVKCYGNSFIITLNVDPTTGMTLSSSPTITAICSGGTVSYTAASATAGVTFSWVRQANASIAEAVTSGSSNVISETLTNTTNTQTTVTYQFTLTKGNCTNIELVTVDVYGKLDGGTVSIDGGITSNKDTICYNTVPKPFTLANVAGGKTPYTYQWQSKPVGAPAVDAWTNIGGATTLAYTPSAPLTESAMYRVQIDDDGCGTVISDTATVTVLPASLLKYPDIRIYACPSTTPVNLSKFIDSLDVTALQWTATGAAPAISATGTIAANALQSNATYTYTYSITNRCVSNTVSKVYLHVLTANEDFRLRTDTVAVCYRYANNLQINRMFGLDDGSSITYSSTPNSSGSVEPHTVKPVAGSIYAGALIFNGSDAYNNGNVLPTINYHGDASAKYMKFTYSTKPSGCLSGKTYTVVVVLTSF